MLKNIFYTGVFEFEGRIYSNAKHKAIISKELFYRVQDRLSNPQKKKKRNFDLTYSGLIKCGHCGCQLVGEVKKGKYVYYHCTGNRGGTCKSDYINETKIDKVVSEVLKLLIIPFEIRQKISNALRVEHEKKNNCSKEIKSNIQKQVSVLENRIEKLFQDKLDGIITYEQWKTFNDKWQVEKDKLSFQLEEINKLDKEFYDKADIILGFTDNAHQYYLQGNLYQKRKILEIISEKITYKDKNFDIELKPIFRQIAENQYIFSSKNTNTRTLKRVDSTRLDTQKDPKQRKNSPGWARTNNLPVNSRLLRH